MTNIISGSDLKVFTNRDEVVGHLLKKILANKNRKVGTEWEIFFVDGNGKAISRADGQKAFGVFKELFALSGYQASYIYECDADNRKTIFGLDVQGIGVITPEMGHQFEFACSVSENCDEVKEKNEEFYRITCEVARRLNYLPVFKGHIPGYVENTEGSYRSRSIQWRKYFDSRFGANSMSMREALDATASSQVTIDSGAEDFHEFFQTLLLIEPALTLHFSNSNRPHIGMKRLPASHMKPIVGVWGTKTAKEALEAVVDRLMEVEVPFLPDPEYPDIYKAEPLIDNCPPTVERLMGQGRLNEKTLNNVGGFLLARPAIRRFSQGLIEMRGVDSQPTSDKVAEIAQRVTSLVYNENARKSLLDAYAHLSAADIQTLHDASCMANKNDALNMRVAGLKIADFIEDIIARSQAHPPKAVIDSCARGNATRSPKAQKKLVRRAHRAAA